MGHPVFVPRIRLTKADVFVVNQYANRCADGGATAPNTIDCATGEFDQNCPNIPNHTRQILFFCVIKGGGGGGGGTDILALKHVSRILVHCYNLSAWFVGVASPPVQCSNTGLEMRNNWWVVAMSANPPDELTCFRARISEEEEDFLAAAQKARPGEQSGREGVSELARKCSHFGGDCYCSGSRSRPTLADLGVLYS